MRLCIGRLQSPEAVLCGGARVKSGWTRRAAGRHRHRGIGRSGRETVREELQWETKENSKKRKERKKRKREMRGKQLKRMCAGALGIGSCKMKPVRSRRKRRKEKDGYCYAWL